MTLRAKTRWSLATVLFLLMPLSSLTAMAQTTNHRSDSELANDLRTVIILAGYPCHSVMVVNQPNQTDYHVSCDADRYYRVHIGEEKGVQVTNRSNPDAASPADALEHKDAMKRHLFFIVNFAGHECGSVVTYERLGANSNIVTCEDQTTYRIHVTPEGRVAVDKQAVEK